MPQVLLWRCNREELGRVHSRDLSRIGEYFCGKGDGARRLLGLYCLRAASVTAGKAAGISVLPGNEDHSQ